MSKHLTRLIAYTTFFLLCNPFEIFATDEEQDTLKIGLNKDAVLDYYKPNTNLGSEEIITAEISGSSAFRSLLAFDLSSVPSGANVVSARLTLQGIEHVSNGNSNASYLSRVTSAWTEESVTWNTQPSVTTVDQVSLNESTDPEEDYVLDITLHVRDMLKNGGNHGFLLQIANPGNECYMRFGSKDHGDSGQHPGIEIIYTTPPPIIYYNTFVPINCADPDNGGIGLEVEGGIPPYTYLWEDKDSYTWTNRDTFANLSLGTFTFTVQDDVGGEISYPVGLGYPVEWMATHKTQAMGLYNITKFEGDMNWYGTGMSNNVLPVSTDGWVEFTVDNINQHRMFGLTNYANTPHQSWDTIGYGFYLNGDNNLIRVENGSQYAFGDDLYELGDVLRLSREGTSMKYYKNGTLLYTSSVANDIMMVVDAALYEEGSAFDNLRASFDLPVRVSFLTTPDDSDEGDPANGSISVTVECAAGTLGYLWSNSSTVEDQVSLVNGDYWLNISVSGYSGYSQTYNVKLCSSDMHYVDEALYDENGVFSGHTKSFLDKLGREVQTQTQNFGANKVVATQTVYDHIGRAAIRSLPATLVQPSIGCYEDQFMTASDPDYYTTQEPYDVIHFEEDPAAYDDRTVNPLPLDINIPGSVGHYYSNNNAAEPYVAADRYPYSRVEYYADPLNRVKRTTLPGEKHKLGSGRENFIFYSNNSGELAVVTGNNIEMFKTVTRDPDGLTSITYSDAAGRVIATAKSGLTNTCNVQSMHTVMKYDGSRSVDIHVPFGKRGNIFLPLNTAGQCTSYSYITYTFTDLETGKVLPGSAYLITNGSVLIYSSYKPNQDLFLRISFEYTGTYLDSIFPLRNSYVSPPDQYVNYKLDYSHWTLNEYDNKTAELIRSYPPAGVDCETYVMDVLSGDGSERGVFTVYDFNTSSYKSDVLNPTAPSFTETFDFFTTGSGSDYTSPTTQAHYLDIRIRSFPIDPDMQLPPGIPCSGVPGTATTGHPSSSIAPHEQYAAVVYEAGNSGGASVGSSMIVRENGESGELTSNDFAAMDEIYQYYYSGQNPLLKMRTDETNFGFLLPRQNTTNDNPCSNLDHCYNGIEDCDEVAADIGGGCGYPKCYNKPPGFFGSYQMVFKIVGKKDGGVYETLDEDGNVTPGARFLLFANLYVTCNCDYYWDVRSFSTARLRIPDDVLNEYVAIHVQLEEINMKVGGSYIDYASAGTAGQFARFMQFDIDADHHFYPRAKPQDIDNENESEYEYNDLGELIAETTPDEGKVEYVYNSLGQVRFQQNAVQQANDKFTYFNYDKAGRLIETGEFDYSSANPKFQNEKYEPALTVPPDISVLEIVDERDHVPDGYCDQRSYYLYDVADGSGSSHYPFGTSPYTGLKQTFLLGKLSKSWSEDEQEITWYSYDMMGRLKFTIQYIDDLAAYKTHHYEYNSNGDLVRTSYQEEVSAERFDHHFTYDSGKDL